jgi:hypothetical protein
MASALDWQSFPPARPCYLPDWKNGLPFSKHAAARQIRPERRVPGSETTQRDNNNGNKQPTKLFLLKRLF